MSYANIFDINIYWIYSNGSGEVTYNVPLFLLMKFKAIEMLLFTYKVDITIFNQHYCSYQLMVIAIHIQIVFSFSSQPNNNVILQTVSW